MVLSTSGFDLIVHQIPKHTAELIVIEQPPRRRERAAVKLRFPVKSIAEVRSLAESLGGEMDPSAKERAYDNETVCMGHDPEGNVFQVSATSQ